MLAEQRVDVRPVLEENAEEVAAFLHDNLNERVSPDAWRRAMTVPWPVDAPNHGFMLKYGDSVVGAYLAFYSDRLVDEVPVAFCNLGAWCVLEDFRAHSVRLLRKLLAQKTYAFTDLSPSGNVVPLNARLKFQSLDTSTVVLPNLPYPSRPGATRILSRPDQIAQALADAELRIYQDHVAAAAAHHVVIQRGDSSTYVIFRKDRRKNLPLFASLLYVSDPGVFLASAYAFGRHLLVRHGIPATLIELRLAGGRPRGSVAMDRARPKMYRSDNLRPDQIDYLYSELVCVAW